MVEFATKVGAAAGLSANFEFVTQMIKLGGNGPIMANALGSYGTPVTYIGNLGAPNVHPIFSDLAKRATVYSIAEPGYTGRDRVRRWQAHVWQTRELEGCELGQSDQGSTGRRARADFLGGVADRAGELDHAHPHDAIWQKILSKIAPRLEGEKRWLFIDLADPAKRSSEDIAAALKQITKFQKYFRVVLGMNLQESRQVGEVLGLKAPEETYGTVTQHAALIWQQLKIDTVVIHPTHFAVAADASGSSHVVGPFTAKPKITTGAGDHFNAGFCIGRLLGLDLESSPADSALRPPATTCAWPRARGSTI
jgi:hypothetical protein